MPLDLPEPPAPPTREEAAAFERELKELLQRELPKLAEWRNLTELRLSRGRSRKQFRKELMGVITIALLHLVSAQDAARRRRARSRLKAGLSLLKEVLVTGAKAAFVTGGKAGGHEGLDCSSRWERSPRFYAIWLACS
jgi:hypothetical protein